MKNQFIDVDNSRFDEQRSVMKKIMAAGHCPFCWENLQKYHKLPILKEGQYWRLTTNQWPYTHTQIHLLAILKEHKETLSELDPQCGQELIEMFAWAEKNFSVPGGGFVIRFGDTDYSAGTVAHLHAQFLVPDIHDPDYDSKPVRVKIGKTKK